MSMPRGPHISTLLKDMEKADVKFEKTRQKMKDAEAAFRRASNAHQDAADEWITAERNFDSAVAHKTLLLDQKLQKMVQEEDPGMLIYDAARKIMSKAFEDPAANVKGNRVTVIVPARLNLQFGDSDQTLVV